MYFNKRNGNYYCCPLGTKVDQKPDIQRVVDILVLEEKV